MDHMVLRERHRKRKQKRLGIMPSHTPDANLLWRHEMKKLRVQVLLTCLFSNLPTYTTLPASPPSSSSANDPFVLQANEAARRSQRRRSVLRAVAWVVGLILLAGALYQSIGHVRDDYLYPPLGIRVNVGHHDAWPHFMHIHCVGSGSPTVLFEAGLPFSSLSFELVMQEVARRDGLAANMTFCSYDRSGYGWSEAGVYPRNISVIVDELHRLLQVAAVPTPYVLAGWSYGGPISQLYAARYPHAVAGLVLIETVIANQTTRIEGFAEHLVEGIRTFDIARFVQWVGVYRLAGELGLLPEASGAPPAFLPTSLYNAVLASVTKYKFPETAYQELLAFEESELIFNEALRPPATKPLQGLPVVNVVAVTEAMSEAERQLWIATQKGEASALTDNYRQAVVYSDHFVPWSKPSSVIDAVRLCIEMSGIQHQPHSHHHLH